jgi:hypothetical protein
MGRSRSEAGSRTPHPSPAPAALDAVVDLSCFHEVTLQQFCGTGSSGWQAEDHQVPPGESLEGAHPVHTLVSDFWPPDYTRWPSCHSEPPSLWPFVPIVHAI